MIVTSATLMKQMLADNSVLLHNAQVKVASLEKRLLEVTEAYERKYEAERVGTQTLELFDREEQQALDARHIGGLLELVFNRQFDNYEMEPDVEAFWQNTIKKFMKE